MAKVLRGARQQPPKGAGVAQVTAGRAVAARQPAMRRPIPMATTSRTGRSTHDSLQTVRAKAAPASQEENATNAQAKDLQRRPPRLAVPSKGRMAEDTLALLKSCQLSVRKPNPRQYVAELPQLPGLEVWFQRASDIVRRLAYGDVDLGILGYDMFNEFAYGNDDLIIIHDSLKYGQCHLALGVPSKGDFEDVHTLDDLKNMGWTKEKPLRVVTGYQNTAKTFFKENGMDNVLFLAADGALEAAPYMGCADIILDLVSTGTTLRENNLKEIVGGRIIESEGIMVASKKALKERPGLLEMVKQIVERLEGHLKADEFYTVTSNMRANSESELAALLIAEGISGLQGPTIASVYTSGIKSQGLFAATVCVRKSNLHDTIKKLRAVGGSGVLVSDLTYIFDEEPLRWKELMQKLET